MLITSLEPNFRKYQQLLGGIKTICCYACCSRSTGNIGQRWIEWSLLDLTKAVLAQGALSQNLAASCCGTLWQMPKKCCVLSSLFNNFKVLRCATQHCRMFEETTMTPWAWATFLTFLFSHVSVTSTCHCNLKHSTLEESWETCVCENTTRKFSAWTDHS